MVILMRFRNWVAAAGIRHFVIIIIIQVCTFHDGCKQGIDQQIFNRKSISRKITHPQSLVYLNNLNKD